MIVFTKFTHRLFPKFAPLAHTPWVHLVAVGAPKERSSWRASSTRPGALWWCRIGPWGQEKGSATRPRFGVGVGESARRVSRVKWVWSKSTDWLTDWLTGWLPLAAWLTGGAVRTQFFCGCQGGRCRGGLEGEFAYGQASMKLRASRWELHFLVCQKPCA